MRVAAVQLEIDDATAPGQRLERAMQLVTEEAGRGADVVVLPEMWLPGFFAFDRYAEVAEPIDGPAAKAFADTARQANVVLHAGSVVERSDARLHNTSLLFDRDGDLRATYRKVHLFSYGSREADLLTRGTDVVVVEVDGARFGLATCYDLRYPELFRKMIDQGAEVFLVVAGWPFPRLDAWRILGRARAIENQAGLVACNASGRQAGGWLCGGSYATDAWGSVLRELDDRPGVLSVDIDVAAIRAARAEFPALAGRVLEGP